MKDPWACVVAKGTRSVVSTNMSSMMYSECIHLKCTVIHIYSVINFSISFPFLFPPRYSSINTINPFIHFIPCRTVSLTFDPYLYFHYIYYIHIFCSFINTSTVFTIHPLFHLLLLHLPSLHPTLPLIREEIKTGSRLRLS